METKNINQEVRDESYFLESFASRSNHPEFTDETKEKVISFFKEKGMTVTKEGLEHNFEGWRLDYKSGYRDEKNGVHIFTPCGCNMLSFRVSELGENLSWQDTYWA